jgi:hypothetical protein
MMKYKTNRVTGKLSSRRTRSEKQKGREGLGKQVNSFGS